MPSHASPTRALSDADVRRFIEDGFVKIEQAFPAALAAAARTVLWQQMDARPDDPATWTKPVVWLFDQTAAPFVEAANTPALHAAFDQLVGPGRWLPRGSLGTFPVRFPTDTEDTGDTGWHIDVSFAGPDVDPADGTAFMRWRANVESRGRALLMLFLFSDVGADDAPTRIRVGSHADIARQLAPAGDAGMTLMELAADGFTGSAHRPEVLATGKAGDVYLCHPFLVHAAQVNRGTRPRFLAQPPLLPKGPVLRDPADGAPSPVEIAIRDALAERDADDRA